MIWEGSEVTDAMRQEAADGWSSVWNYVDGGRPSEILVDRNCKEVEPRRARKPRAQRAPEPVASEPARFFTCKCPSEKHGELTGCSGTGSSMTEGLCAWCVSECRPHVHVIPPGKASNGTNGVNGHQNGAL